MKYSEIHVAPLNATYCQIGADNAILKELSDFFSFEVPNAQFMAKVKYGMWDGRKRLFNLMNQTLYTGLFGHLQVFARDRDYKIIEYDSILQKKTLVHDDYERFMTSLNIHSDGNKITPYYFQETSIIHGITNNRATIVSPTSSGKSLIIYALSEYHRREGKRILIIVPTVSLVVQLYSDFKDYSSEIEWDVAEYCHKIYAGEDKDSIKPIIISTWQSMQKKKPDYFKKFDAVIVDEVHTAKADQITRILECSTNAHIRYGLTGTLQDCEMNRLVILGLLGPDKKIIGTKQLMDEGYVADLSIKVLMLKYSEEDRKELRRLCLDAKKNKTGSGYAIEMDFISKHKPRMNQLIGLSKATKGNTLILFQYVEKHGKIIAKMLADQTDKKVLYVSGETKPEDREKIRKMMELEDDILLVASSGVFSTGISIKNIHNVIFASPSKSKIKVLQSIGRGLRMSKTKTEVTLFDIVDDLTYQAKKHAYPNYTLKHFHERFKIYRDEKFKIKIYERQIK
jgi:superfamily II DNA or RNA helicase